MGDILSIVGFFGCLYYLGCFIKALVIQWPTEEYLVGLGWSVVALAGGFALTITNNPVVDKVVLCASLLAVVAFIVLKYGRIVLEKAGALLDKLKKKLGIRTPEIVGVKYIGTVSTDSRRGGLKGALLGGLFFGDLGAAIGGLTPSGSKTLCRFAVCYDNGKVVMEDWPKGYPRYNQLMEYVRWDEL